MLKSKYNLEFPGITRSILEKEFENNLPEKLKQFVPELGYANAHFFLAIYLPVSNNQKQ